MDFIQCLLIKTFFISIILQNIFVNAKVDIPEDAKLSPSQMVKKYGHRFKTYEVTTEDGYILKIFRIFGLIYKPVLLVHGVISGGDTFLYRGKTSMAIALADKGYDVWLINCRGNKFSRGHTTLNPDNDKAYWDFTFDEMGTKDLPATIDFVLGKTGQSKLPAVGHSQGTQILLVLTSLKPEYNAKLSIVIALAPIAYLNNLPAPYTFLVPSWPAINAVLITSGQEELLNNNSTFITLYQKFCEDNVISEIFCENVLFTLAGYDPAQLELSFLPVIVENYPTSTSRKNVDHLAQIYNRKEFARYDVGLDNLSKYGTLQPPDYPVQNITARVALLVGKNDRLSTIADVNILRKQLTNVIYHEMENELCNHLDFIWGKNMSDYLFPLVFNLLKNGELPEKI